MIDKLPLRFLNLVPNSKAKVILIEFQQMGFKILKAVEAFLRKCRRQVKYWLTYFSQYWCQTIQNDFSNFLFCFIFNSLHFYILLYYHIILYNKTLIECVICNHFIFIIFFSISHLKVIKYKYANLYIITAIV